MDARVGRAWRLVEQRHVAEDRARPEHRQRLLAHPRHVAADADLALDDDVELVARIAVLENLVPSACDSSVVTREMSSSAVSREAGEERHLRELGGAFG